MKSGHTLEAPVSSPPSSEVLDGNSTVRPLRADAAKNRQRLLAAAEDVFAVDGVQAQVDLIAQRAGLGIGTLYRHFPTKEALIEAIISSRLGVLTDRVNEYVEADDAGTAFFSFLHEFGREAAAKRDLIDSLGIAGIDIKANCADSFGALKKGVKALLQRAQAAGAVRDDVKVDDVIGLVAGTCQAIAVPNRDAAWIDRMVDIVCDGLRRQ